MNHSISERVVVFEASAPLAHFKRFYTTSSPTSYALPPRTALQGLMGAILGYSREEYLSKLESLQVAVSLQAPVKRIRLGTNWINTKSGTSNPSAHWQLFVGSVEKPRSPRSPIRIEFLKDANYCIYVNHPDPNLLNKLESMLRDNQTVYTPCLGISECIATLIYIGSRNIVAFTDGQDVEHISAVPSDLLAKNGFKMTENQGAQVFKERLPSVMHADRSVSVYREVIFEARGEPLYLKTRGAPILESGKAIAYL